MNSFYNQFADYDIALLRFIHHNRIMALDSFLYYFSFATTFVSISLLLIILFQSIKIKSVALRVKFFKSLTVFIFAAILSLSLKNLIVRDRPFIRYPDIEKLSEAGNSSFPSGHTIEAFAVALAISILFPRRKYVIPVFLWAFLVAYSRVALGVHYPLDIIAGIFLGLIVSFFTLQIWNSLEWKKKIV